MTNSADTHCPYCALQCAMTLTSPAAPAPAVQPGPDPVPARRCPARGQAGRDFPTNRGGLCRKGWTSASLLNHPGRVTEPLLKGRRRRPPPDRLGRGADAHHHSGEGQPAPGTGRTPSACSAAAGSPTRRPTSWASSPGWPWAPRGSTTTAGSACPPPPPPACAPSALDRGLPVPAGGPGHRQHHPDARLQRRRDHAAVRPAPAGRARRRRADRGGPAPLRHRGVHGRRRRPAPAAPAGHRPRPAAGPLPRGDPRGPRRHRLHRGAHHGLRAPWSAASPPSGPNASSPSPASRPG